MAKELRLNLPSADNLFSSQEERDDEKRERVMELPLSEISNFPNHPFKVNIDDEMREMAESVRQYGVLVPCLVRLKEDGGYEMVAGHRRKIASELAERELIPCIIRDLTDDEATIIMVDSNLQREKILPSEKAFAYKMKLNAIKRQGQRVDLTSSPMEMKLRGKQSLEIVGELSGDSKAQVHRFIRITELIPDALKMVDEGKIAMRPAVELSYLPKEEQQLVFQAIESEDSTPSYAQAVKLRRFSDDGRLNDDVVLSIMQEEKPNQVEQFKMPKASISKYFAPGTSTEKMQDTIVKALELWQKREQQRKNQRNDLR